MWLIMQYISLLNIPYIDFGVYLWEKILNDLDLHEQHWPSNDTKYHNFFFLPERSSVELYFVFNVRYQKK